MPLCSYPLRMRTALLTLTLVFAATITAHPSWGIVVNSRGEIYYSDLITVWKIDRSGHVGVARAGVEGRHVHELAIDANDNVYGPDYDGTTTRVWKMTPSGAITYINTAGVWRDRNGNSYSVDENEHLRVQTLILKNGARFAGGRFGHADGAGANARFGHIVALTVADAIYVTDDPSVRRISFDGVVTTIARDLDRPRSPNAIDFGSLFGLSVDRNGDVYVADFRNRRVLKIAKGVVSTIATSPPPWSPTGVAVGPHGEIYALEIEFRPPSTWLPPRVRRVR